MPQHKRENVETKLWRLRIKGSVCAKAPRQEPALFERERRPHSCGCTVGRTVDQIKMAAAGKSG